MNPFEKIFNYQILSRLDDSGTFMVTSHERAWLKTMLQHPAAADAFTPETLGKLSAILQPDKMLDTSEHLMEKAGTTEKQVYHPLLRALRRHIMNKSGILITYRIKEGRIYSEQSGFPYKLEYSMVKREWYLLWYHFDHDLFMSTPLHLVLFVSAEPVKPGDADEALARIGGMLDGRKIKAVIEVVREYNRELSRILYALSSIEKDVEYDAVSDVYRVRLCLLSDEQEYLLSKLRFLGKRVKIVKGEYLQKRMLETTMKALARYETATWEGTSKAASAER